MFMLNLVDFKMYKIYSNNSKSFFQSISCKKKKGVIFYYYYYSDTKMYTAHAVYILYNIIPIP